VPPSCPTGPPLLDRRSPTARANSTAVSPSACVEGVDESSPKGRHPEAGPRRIRSQAVMTERTPAPATSDPAIDKRKAGDRHQGRPDAAASSCRTGPEDLDSRRNGQVEAVTRSGDFTGWPQVASGSKAAASSRSRESSSCASKRNPCQTRDRPHSALCIGKAVRGRLSPSPTTQGPPALRNWLLKGCPGHVDTGGPWMTVRRRAPVHASPANRRLHPVASNTCFLSSTARPLPTPRRRSSCGTASNTPPTPSGRSPPSRPRAADDFGSATQAGTAKIRGISAGLRHCRRSAAGRLRTHSGTT